jgi:hypothetical protein
MRVELGCPDDSVTVTELTAWEAMRSACSTAARIASAAASISTTAPARTPREDWWPTPTTRGRGPETV